MRILRGLVLIGVLLGSGFLPLPALATDDGHSDGTGGVANGAIFAGVQYGTPPSGKGKKDTNGCVWVPAGEASTFDSAVVDKRVVNGVTQRLFLRACPKSIQGVWVSQVSGVNLAKVSQAMIEQRLPKPKIGSAPVTTQGIVNVGMWLWTDSAQYTPVSVTAWVPTPTGIAQATTTARPQRLVYAPGEPGGTLVSCNGSGDVWRTWYPDDLTSSCMYTYRHSSQINARGKFGAELSIVWGISWSSNVAAGRALPDYITTTQTDVTVREIQAVIVN